VRGSYGLIPIFLLVPTIAFGAGFEVPENTTKSVARGGTGAVSKADPSALYFNPALLPRARGIQVLLDLNVLKHDVSFSRDDLVVGDTRREFEPTENTDGFFPAPFFAASYDFGIEGFAAGVGVFGPSAYGKRCLGKRNGDTCEYEYSNSAKHMMVDSDIVEVYFTLGAGYTIDLGSGGNLSFGLAGALAWQETNFSVVVDELQVSPPFNEDPQQQSYMKAENLSDFQPTGFVGVAWEHSGFRVGASYRPPIDWDTTGEFSLEFPPAFSELAELDGNTLNFKTKQAGSLRAGISYEYGEHPGLPSAPLFDIEFNYVWEDWSRVDNFEIEPRVQLLIVDVPQPLNSVLQRKGWQDTHSFRLGGSFGATSWLTLMAGAAYETAAMPIEYTNIDFASWERTSFGGGLSVHALDWLEVSLAYSATMSPDRTVTNGAVYQSIPTSGCTGPDYQDAACANPGTPPGNPQNNGQWSTFTQIISVGTSFKF